MWNEKDIGDLSGKLYIVTGGNTGLGFRTTQYLTHTSAEFAYLPLHSVFLKQREEGLGNRVVAAVSSPTHACL